MKFNLDNFDYNKGRIAIVTGANNGIGFETTIGLVEFGFKVIMACRNMDKAQKAKEDILQLNPNADLDLIQLDLSRFGSVRDFAKQFKAKYKELHVLINNAGILDYSGRKNEDGIEIQLATNHLGHFLLTSLLIDIIPDDSDSRVVSLSSIAHKQGSINIDDLNCENVKDNGFAYAQSKLACLMFSDELHRRLKNAGKKIISVCAHPGGSDSGLFDDMSRIRYFILKLLAPLITHSNKEAAKPSIYAALGKEVKGGDYYGPQGFNDLKGTVGYAKRTDYSKNLEVASKLWEESEKLVEIHFGI